MVTYYDFILLPYIVPSGNDSTTSVFMIAQRRYIHGFGHTDMSFLTNTIAVLSVGHEEMIFAVFVVGH